MKKFKNRFRYILALAFVLLLSYPLAGCSNSSQAENDPDKIDVVASFYPMEDFVKKIGGDKVEVSCMVPSSQEPHDWEPTAQDVAHLNDCDLFVYSGVGMESWVDSVKSTFEKDKPYVVEASKGCNLIQADHDHHEHGEHEGHEEHEEHAYDPHVWLSPLNAKIEMQNICEGLCKVDPDNASYYKKNLEMCSLECDKLEREYSDALSKCTHKEIIVSHEAYGYLCHDFSLEQIGIEGIEPDQEPDPARMAEIVDLTREKNIKTIFTESLLSPKVAEQIADETGCKVEELNPLEGLSEKEQKENKEYFSVMRDNLEKLKVALIDNK